MNAFSLHFLFLDLNQKLANPPFFPLATASIVPAAPTIGSFPHRRAPQSKVLHDARCSSPGALQRLFFFFSGVTPDARMPTSASVHSMTYSNGRLLKHVCLSARVWGSTVHYANAFFLIMLVILLQRPCPLIGNARALLCVELNMGSGSLATTGS